jgi:hypothetical protein
MSDMIFAIASQLTNSPDMSPLARPTKSDLNVTHNKHNNFTMKEFNQFLEQQQQQERHKF